jgi:hypothetical protein
LYRLSVEGLPPTDGGLSFMSALFSAVLRRLFPFRVRALKEDPAPAPVETPAPVEAPASARSGLEAPIISGIQPVDTGGEFKPGFIIRSTKDGGWTGSIFADSVQQQKSGSLRFWSGGTLVAAFYLREDVMLFRERQKDDSVQLWPIAQRAETPVQRETEEIPTKRME